MTRPHLVMYLGLLLILHIEFETDAHSEMPQRMLEYYGILYRKHKKPIIPLVVCPFRTDIADPPLEIKSGDKEVLVFNYRVIRLWKYNAREYLDKHMVAIYALLPTMQGANYEVLSQALDEMKAWYVGRTRQLASHLLWLGVCLQRTDTVTQEDKERIQKKMSDFNSLLDENSFVQKRRAEGVVEGEIKASQRAIITIVRGRFPALTELAQEQVAKIDKPDVLDYLIEQVSTAPDEAMVRHLLHPTAA